MALPLEISDPEVYGTFDRQQIELVAELHAYDLVLIENATELFRQVMHDRPGNLERMLELIVNSSDRDCVYLHAETFPYYLNPQTRSDYPRAARNSMSTARAYQNAVRRYKNNHLTNAIKNHDCIVTLVATDLDEAGGHYAAYVWTKNNRQLVIFDSMSTVYGPSSYYPFFQQLGRDLFGNIKEMVVPCIKGLISLQYTGGFAGNTPYFTDITLDPLIETARLNNDEDRLARLLYLKDVISLQSPESQNHFCYMWSIWFINALLAGLSLDDLLQEIITHNIDPLFVIKRYSWGMLQLAGLEDQLAHAELYYTYFPRVWYHIGSPMSTNFKPFELQMPTCTDPQECLTASVSPAELREVAITIPPTVVLETITELTQF